MRAAVVLLLVVTACANRAAGPRHPTGGQRTPSAVGEEGKASWYGDNLNGSETASGERYNQNEMTAAHRKLPMHAQVKVTNLKNGLSVVVRINDRGPYVKGRIIDLSKAAATRLKMLTDGVVPARVEVISLPAAKPRR
jgi:rare lipoprotein A